MAVILSWLGAASGAGLERGGPDEAYFLMLRATAMPNESHALQAKTAEEIAAGRKRIQEMFESRGGEFQGAFEDAEQDNELDAVIETVARTALPGEAEMAMASGDETALAQACSALRELLFFMEGKPN